MSGPKPANHFSSTMFLWTGGGGWWLLDCSTCFHLMCTYEGDPGMCIYQCLALQIIEADHRAWVYCAVCVCVSLHPG